jgi:hypothetical protein
LGLRATIKDWVTRTVARNEGCPWRGGHDEANFTTSFCDYYLFTGDERVRSFLHELRDAYLAWAKSNYYHGFAPDAKDYATHTFELADGFISALASMEPDDPVNEAFIEDVAHHVGNWVPEVPAWYDWKAHRLISHWVGTRAVRSAPPYDFTAMRHARIGNLALTTYLVTGDRKYLDWCRDFAGGWVETILTSTDRIPMLRYHTPVEQWPACSEAFRKAYSDPYQGTRWAGEANQMIRLLLRLYVLDRQARYLQAAEKAIRLIGAATGTHFTVALMQEYDSASGAERYGEQLAAYHRENLLPALQRAAPLPAAVLLEVDRPGKRFVWRDQNGQLVDYAGPSVSDYLEGWRATAKVDYLARGMSLAERELKLVARAFRDGRDHGCDGGLYAHGAGNQAARALYDPAGRKLVRYFRSDDKLGLHEKVAVALDPSSSPNRPTLLFYDTDEQAKQVKIRAEAPHRRILQAAADGFLADVSANGLATIRLEPGRMTKVTLFLSPAPAAAAP